MNSAAFIALDNGCRGAAAGLLLMFAAVLFRNRNMTSTMRIGAALAVAGAASAIIEAPGFPSQWPWISLPFIALSSGGSVFFWLWARAAFDDDFVLRPWHRGLWFALVGLTLLASYGAFTRPAASLIDRALTLTNLVLAVLAVVQTVTTWRTDLVARRRRLRVTVLMGTLTYIGTNAVANLSSVAILAWVSPARNLANAIGLCLLAVLAGWSLFRTATSNQTVTLTPAGASADGRSLASIESDDRSEIDPALLNRLERLMTQERVYRREGLTIGSLAALMKLPEYRLRQIINEGLGYRNFNAFLNRYRIDEAKAALADPSQKEVPVLTIAMDAGFQSLGPFNRAFKADTDVTPTEFRRLALTRAPSKPQSEARNFEIGQSY